MKRYILLFTFLSSANLIYSQFANLPFEINLRMSEKNDSIAGSKFKYTIESVDTLMYSDFYLDKHIPNIRRTVMFFEFDTLGRLISVEDYFKKQVFNYWTKDGVKSMETISTDKLHVLSGVYPLIITKKIIVHGENNKSINETIEFNYGKLIVQVIYHFNSALLITDRIEVYYNDKVVMTIALSRL